MSTQHPAALPPLPERDGKLTSRAQGVYRKFDVRRTDGSDQPGGKHHGCEYFVLDVTHDPHAKAAMQAYADACESTHMFLAADMRDRYGLSSEQAQPSLTDERITELVYAQDPKFDQWHEGLSIDDVIAIVRAAIATQAAQPEQSELGKERTARQEAQRELERFKGLLAAARVNLMRELKEQGWVQAQGVPAGAKFFSYGSDSGFEIHDTAAAAMDAAQADIDMYKEEAHDGWAEEVDQVCWGVVLGMAQEVDQGPAPGGSDFDRCVDYKLAAAPQAAPQQAEPLSDGVIDALWFITPEHPKNPSEVDHVSFARAVIEAANGIGAKGAE